MKLCFTIDDVIRAKTAQFGKMYKKYVNPEIDLEALDLSTDELFKVFGFKTKEEYNKFLYEDYTFEVFAEAPVTEKMVDKNFNNWLLALNYNEEIKEPIEVLWANPREFNISIGFTHFFLSQIATRVRKTIFPADYSDIWKECDVLVTADPKLINEKPEGKICVKIEMPYNKECNADITYAKLSELITDAEFFKKIYEKQ